MQIREYAESIVLATTLANKLRPPPSHWTDDDRGQPLRLQHPKRPPELVIAPARSVKVPPLSGMQDRSQRRRILHALANHELQASELFAWMILAFPDEPTSFRRGLVKILVEEQQHCQLYINRIRALGGDFGDYPVTGHFWNHINMIQSPLDFLCVMGLTFENANLDFAHDYAAKARAVGDEKTALAIETVHNDEIRHVAFAWRWIQKWKPKHQTTWQCLEETLQFPLSPSRARGRSMYRESRVAAGMDEDFIQHLEKAVAIRPNGRER